MNKIIERKLKHLRFNVDKDIVLTDDEKLEILNEFVKLNSTSKLRRVFVIHVMKNHRPKNNKRFYCIVCFKRKDYANVQYPFFL